ncbi:hypothetical protein BHE74_00027642 [Ensete ventricosum]|nr:hypothetical protein GW17_00035132 [Ensete ventricosum]RWW65074.1 hypothetical protein BHE74_00027642 [Ensete ventricosum]
MTKSPHKCPHDIVAEQGSEPTEILPQRPIQLCATRVALGWICHHYCAMLMALISLTWEIKQQPDCAYKQVSAFGISNYHEKCFSNQHVWYFAERGATFPYVGYDARCCYAFTKQISASKAVYSHCTGQGAIS